MQSRAAAIALLYCVITSHGAPLAPPASTVSISPESRAVLERSSRLYGGLKSLSVELQTQSTNVYSGKTVKRRDLASVQWDRRGLLRLTNTINGSSIMDGKRLWKGQGQRYDVESVASDEKVTATLEEIRGSFGGGYVLIQLLQGQVPIVSRLRDYSKADIKLGPTTSIEGKPCDVVEMELLTKAAGAIMPFRHQYRLWFGQRDGKLIRLRVRMHGHRGDGALDDTRLSNQSLNPAFATATFKIPPPKSGATLR